MPHPFDASDLEVLEAFGRRLRQLRGWRELSQDALAARAGVSRDHIARIEQGRVSAGVLVLHKLATGLGISLEELFADGLPASWQPRRAPTARKSPEFP